MRKYNLMQFRAMDGNLYPWTKVFQEFLVMCDAVRKTDTPARPARSAILRIPLLASKHEHWDRKAGAGGVALMVEAAWNRFNNEARPDGSEWKGNEWQTRCPIWLPSASPAIIKFALEGDVYNQKPEDMVYQIDGKPTTKYDLDLLLAGEAGQSDEKSIFGQHGFNSSHVGKLYKEGVGAPGSYDSYDYKTYRAEKMNCEKFKEVVGAEEFNETQKPADEFIGMVVESLIASNNAKSLPKPQEG